jgi:FlaA1/EpsC-like NDP-sugar epimerase
MKRIDMIEYNVAESIKTNILGSLNIVDCCLKNNVENAIYVSTDKACSPINTYGSCKFVSERIFTESNFSKGKARTIFASVRYGNVLNSTGSIVEIIKNKIKSNQEIPLTDERMTRFFIGVEKAVDLIFNAIKYAKGGEVFVPKLVSFRITDLIEVLKNHYNYPKKVKLIGIRPGEKLHEVMVNESESPRTFQLGNTFVITSQIEKYQLSVRYGDIKRKNRVNFIEYSSRDSIVGKEKIIEMLKNCNLLD